MNHAVINIEAALENLGGDRALLHELAEMMLPDLDGYRHSLQTSLSQGDLTTAYQQAHSLKGAVSNFVAEPLRQAALELELAGKHGEMDAAQAALPKVLDAMDAFEAALRDLVS